MDTLLTLQAARLTGLFALPTSAEHAKTRYTALQEYIRLDQEITRLRSAAMKETQLSRQVEINLEVKRKEANLGSIKKTLIYPSQPDQTGKRSSLQRGEVRRGVSIPGRTMQ